MSSRDGNRSGDLLEVSHYNRSKKKKNRRPIEPKYISGYITLVPDIQHHPGSPTHIYVVPFRTMDSLVCHSQF